MLGPWNGIDENGIVDKEITPLEAGDQVTLLVRTMTEESHECRLTPAEAITIGEDGGIISEPIL